MKAAVVRELGKPPVYGEFVEPVAGASEANVAVRAASMSQLTRSRASGAHYSGTPSVPLVPGFDGVGTLGDGRRVYFVLPREPFGSMGERVPVRNEHCVPVPDELDDVAAAAIANPGMSSWAALRERANIRAGETVLINGATGTSGRLAVQIAKHFGARRVIATGRNAAALARAKAVGADVTITLGDDSGRCRRRSRNSSRRGLTSCWTTFGARVRSGC